MRRSVSEEYYPDCETPTIIHGGNSFMLLKYMVVSGISEIFFCEGRMNSEKYINMFETDLLPPLTNILDNTDLN